MHSNPCHLEFDVAPYRLSGVVYGTLLNHEPAIASLGPAAELPPYKAPAQAPVLYIKPRNTLAGHGDAVMVPADAPALWRQLQRRGKRLSVTRLAKASFTYAGGIDYLAWKINRHAGTKIEIKPWQRRWPLLGAVTLLPRLFLGGSIR